MPRSSRRTIPAHAVRRTTSPAREESLSKSFIDLFADALKAPRVTRHVPYPLAYAGGFLLEIRDRLLMRERPPRVTRYGAWLLGRHLEYSTEKARARLGWQPGDRLSRKHRADARVVPGSGEGLTELARRLLRGSRREGGRPSPRPSPDGRGWRTARQFACHWPPAPRFHRGSLSLRERAGVRGSPQPISHPWRGVPTASMIAASATMSKVKTAQLRIRAMDDPANTRAASAHLKERARQLRRNATIPERTLWGLLRDRRLAGIKFRRQHVVGPFVVDFYCLSERLVVELDGRSHDDRGIADRRRQDYLENVAGLRVVRVANDDVLHDPESVILGLLRTLGLPTV